MGTTGVHDDVELVASDWVRPVVALERHSRGEIDLVFPTLRSLATLARFDHASEVLAALDAMPRASRWPSGRRARRHRRTRAPAGRRPGARLHLDDSAPGSRPSRRSPLPQRRSALDAGRRVAFRRTARTAEAGSRRSERALAAGPARHRAEPGLDDRARDEHLPGRHRRGRGDRSRSRRSTVTSTRSSARRCATACAGCCSRTRTPTTGRRRNGSAKRPAQCSPGSEPRSRRPTTFDLKLDLVLDRRRDDRGHRVPTRGAAHTGPCAQPLVLLPRGGAHVVHGRPRA